MAEKFHTDRRSHQCARCRQGEHQEHYQWNEPVILPVQFQAGAAGIDPYSVDIRLKELFHNRYVCYITAYSCPAENACMFMSAAFKSRGLYLTPRRVYHLVAITIGFEYENEGRATGHHTSVLRRTSDHWVAFDDTVGEVPIQVPTSTSIPIFDRTDLVFFYLLAGSGE